MRDTKQLHELPILLYNFWCIIMGAMGVAETESTFNKMEIRSRSTNN
jgi:hypothetical protein